MFSNLKRVEIFLVASILGLVFSGTLAGYAQVLEEPFVRITTPDPGDHVPPGNLTIYGRSSDNATNSCLVSVTLNDEWPLDPAEPTGSAGNEDYSRWTYTFTPYFSIIKNGENKIESNIFCEQNGANATAWDSVNVTGDPLGVDWTNQTIYETAR